MRVEQRPNEGDTVKVHFSEWTKMGTENETTTNTH